MNRLGKPNDQQEYIQGWEACFNNEGKDENPYKNWFSKNAEIKKIYWDMGWDACRKPNGQKTDLN